MPAISVIVPVYNKRKYLNAMLNSVLQQSFTDFEMIIVNDGSTDGSRKIIDTYAIKDSRIKVHHIENSGVSHARNVGLNTAKGDYITFIDSDDTIAADYLQTLYGFITENNVEIVISGIVKVWADMEEKIVILPPYTGKMNIRDILDEFVSIQKQTGIYGYCAAKIFSREMIGEERFNETFVLAEDFDFYLRLYRKIKSVYFGDYAGYYYVQAAENSPMCVRDDQIDYYSQLLIQVRFADFLKRMGAYSGENRTIVEKSINDYIYLTLHYAGKETFDQKFRNVYAVYRNIKTTLNGSNTRQKIVLAFVKKNKRQMAKVAVMGYHILRKVIRRS